MKFFHHKARRLAAFLIGAVFFLTGSLKLMDPVGTGLIVEEYFKFFHLDFLRRLSFFTGEALSFVECFTGIALMTGVFRKVTAALTTSLVAFFTIVTLFLWIFNPDMDCGCFGEAVHLTHFQSFAKNVILDALAAAAFLPVKDYGKPKKVKYVTFSLIAASSVSLAVYSLLYIPLVDFTPFNYSSMLYAAENSESSSDDYVAVLVYSKNGQEGLFTIDGLPDSTWTYVRTETRKKLDNIDETSFPKLSFTDRNGEYRDTLATKGNVIVVSLYRPRKITEKGWNTLADFVSDVSASGMEPIVLAASSNPEKLVPASVSPDRRDALIDRLYTADYRTLISLNRSNGGAVYFNDGNLIEKWSEKKLPSLERLKELQRKDAVETMLSASTKGRVAFQAYLLYTFALALIF